jgi:hypothetical protein
LIQIGGVKTTLGGKIHMRVTVYLPTRIIHLGSLRDKKLKNEETGFHRIFEHLIPGKIFDFKNICVAVSVA